MIIDLLKTPIAYIDRLFVWIYGTKLNPLQRSGALTVGILISVIVSGTYLLFFYSVGDPHGSLIEIENQWYLGKWIRSFHRYASDLAVLVVIYHSLSMLVQRRSWGPRTLAWLSGTFLMCSLFISGWTGFVMVWDAHGQEMAQEGARLFQLVPFLREDLVASFSGENPIPGSFFFMNLFLHVAVPLGMVIGLWIHISKMGSVKIFPNSLVFKLLVGSLILASLLFPAPLLKEGDLGAIVGTIPFDIWFGFFLPISKTLSPLLSVGIVAFGLLTMVTAIYWSAPKDRNGKLTPLQRPEFHPSSGRVYFKSVIGSLFFLGIVLMGSQIPIKMNDAQAILRLNFRFANLRKRDCHKPTTLEKGDKLSHMQLQEICVTDHILYGVRVYVDSEKIYDEVVRDTRSEQHKFRLNMDYDLKPGEHAIDIEIVAKNEAGETLNRKSLHRNFEFEKGRIRLISFDGGFK